MKRLADRIDLFLLTAAVLLALAAPAPAQTVMDRLAAVEANTAELNGRLAVLETKVDALAAKVDALAPRGALTHLGYTWTWSAANRRYEPAGAGWQFDGANWWRYKSAACACGAACGCGANCPCPPVTQGMAPARPVAQPPAPFQAFGGPMAGAACRGGG